MSCFDRAIVNLSTKLPEKQGARARARALLDFWIQQAARLRKRGVPEPSDTCRNGPSSIIHLTL